MSKKKSRERPNRSGKASSAGKGGERGKTRKPEHPGKPAPAAHPREARAHRAPALSRSHLARAAIGVSLVALFVLISLFKFSVYRSIPAFNSSDEAGLFSSESAFHYRYSRLLASGEKIPSLDVAAQWPEGLRVRRNITVLMEYVPASLYGLANALSPGVKFHVFLIGFVCFWSSLSVFPLFFLSLKMWSSKWGALVSSALYVFSVGSFDRTIGNLLREDFTLPFIFGSLVLFVYSIAEKHDRKALVVSVLSGVCLFVALGAWHLTQFYFALFSVGVAVCAVVGVDRRRLLRSFLVLTLSAVAAGLFFDVLRTRLFFLSHPLVVSYALIATAWLAERRGYSRFRFGFFLAAVSLCGGVLIWVLTRGYLEYSHVYSLMVEKLRHLGVKPENPSSISYDARVFWQGPFNSPSAASTLFYLGHLVPAIVFPLGALFDGIRKRRFVFEKNLLVFFVLSFLVLYLLMDRMGVFLLFFICAVAGGVFTVARKRVAVAFVLASLGLVVGLYESASFKNVSGIVGWYSRLEARSNMSAAMVSDLDRAQLTEWIRGSTDSNSVFLTWMAEGSDVLKDTGRPVNMHSMFEAKEIRDKNREFLKGLYSGEEVFRDVFARFRSDYFVYRADFVLDESKDSERYVADALRLSRRSAAYKFHFEPDSLDHFRCVYENRFYRVFTPRFRVLEPGFRIVRRSYNGLFELRLFEPDGPTGEYFSDAGVPGVLTRLNQAVQEHSAAMMLHAMGRTEEAYAGLQRALALDPGIAEAWLVMAGISASRGNVQEAVSQLERCLEIEPDNATALANLGSVYVRAGMAEQALELLGHAARLETTNAGIHFNLAEAYFALQRLEDAAREYRQAIQLDPMFEPAYVSLGRIYAFQNRLDLAAGLWETAVQIDPGDETARALLARVREVLAGSAGADQQR